MRIALLAAVAAALAATLPAQADDALGRIDPREFAHNVAVWAAFNYTVADRDIDFRQTAAEAK